MLQREIEGINLDARHVDLQKVPGKNLGEQTLRSGVRGTLTKREPLDQTVSEFDQTYDRGVDESVTMEKTMNSMQKRFVGRQPADDVVADFGSFLEKRKEKHQLQRDTQMSYIDNLVGDLNREMHSIEAALKVKRKRTRLEDRQKETPSAPPETPQYKATVDLKENALKEGLSDFISNDGTSVADNTVDASQLDADDTVLKKRSSNERPSQRKSVNIFTKERKSHNGSQRDSEFS